ncbi:hypothetical protein HDU81_003443 [Chytriomyces hyalinus]|nr:hypothetical protein HDU81_003443 [Chytriomyces hyalinus]
MFPLATLLAVLTSAAFTAAQGKDVTCADAVVFAGRAYDQCATLKPNAAAYNTCACQPTSAVLGWIYNVADACDANFGFQSPLIKQIGCDGLQCGVGDAIAVRVFIRCGLGTVPIPGTPITPAQEACICKSENREFLTLYDAAACSSVKLAPLCSGAVAPATSSVSDAPADPSGAPTSSVASTDGTASAKPASATSVSSKAATAIATVSATSAVSSKSSASSVAASACLVFGASLLF